MTSDFPEKVTAAKVGPLGGRSKVQPEQNESICVNYNMRQNLTRQAAFPLGGGAQMLKI